MVLRRGLWSSALVSAAASIASLGLAAGASAADFKNSSVADVALSYVGKWGGEACRGARRSGLTGSTTSFPVLPQRDPATGRVFAGHEGDGQCRAFVNCVVKLASGGTVWLGGGGGDYFARFRDVGARRIRRLAGLRKGDVVQEGTGIHTYIVVRRVDGEVFDVVDSNGDLKETVLHRHRRVVLNDQRRAYRLGSVNRVDADSAVSAARHVASQLPDFVVDLRSLARKRVIGKKRCRFAAAHQSSDFGEDNGFVKAFCRGRSALQGFSIDVFLLTSHDVSDGASPFACRKWEDPPSYTCAVIKTNRLMVFVSDTTRGGAARIFRDVALTVTRYAKPLVAETGRA